MMQVRRLNPQGVAAWWHGGHPGWAIYPVDSDHFMSTGVLDSLPVPTDDISSASPQGAPPPPNPLQNTRAHACTPCIQISPAYEHTVRPSCSTRNCSLDSWTPVCTPSRRTTLPAHPTADVCRKHISVAASTRVDDHTGWSGDMRGCSLYPPISSVPCPPALRPCGTSSRHPPTCIRRERPQVAGWADPTTCSAAAAIPGRRTAGRPSALPLPTCRDPTRPVSAASAANQCAATNPICLFSAPITASQCAAKNPTCLFSAPSTAN